MPYVHRDQRTNSDIAQRVQYCKPKGQLKLSERELVEEIQRFILQHMVSIMIYWKDVTYGITCYLLSVWVGI